MAELLGRAGLPALIFSALTLAVLGRARPLEPVRDALEEPPELHAPESGHLRILCVGDSLTAMSTSRYPRLLAQAIVADYALERVYVAAAPGLSSGELLKAVRFGRVAERVSPDAVLLLVGTNDAKRSPDWTGRAAYRAHLRALVAEFRRANPRVCVLIATPPPIGRSSLLFPRASAQRLERCLAPAAREVAAEEGAVLVDLFRLFQGRPRLLGPDGVHPSREGHSAMADAFLDALRREGLVREAGEQP